MYPFLRRIKDLENLHSGEECYIFGDGSSVKQFELSAFADRISIAVGLVPRHIESKHLNLRYWIVAEPGFFLPPLIRLQKTKIKKFKNRKKFQSLYRTVTLNKSSIIRITSVANLFGEWFAGTYFFWDKLPRRNCHDDHPNTDDMFADSICSALTLAQYLGFRKVFLIGFDYTHNPPMAKHWYESVPSEVSNEVPTTWHLEFFNAMRKHIEIVTVTSTPQSTGLSSIDYQTLTGQALRHRENSELLSREDLETLAQFKGYKIF